MLVLSQTMSSQRRYPHRLNNSRPRSKPIPPSLSWSASNWPLPTQSQTKPGLAATRERSSCRSSSNGVPLGGVSRIESNRAGWSDSRARDMAGADEGVVWGGTLR